MAFSLAAWQISLRFVNFFSFPTNTDISRVYEMEKKFPAVTICNYNTFLKSKLTDDDYKLLNSAEELSHFYDISSSSLKEIMYKDLEKKYPGGGDVGQMISQKGWTLQDGSTLISCTFRGKPCDLSSWTHRFTAFGNCYTFNGDSSQKLTQILPGSSNGLTVELDILSDEYSTEVPQATRETGARFLVHPEYEPPYAVWEGLSVSPGTHANAGIKEKYHTNLGGPWGECDPGMKVSYSKQYTRSACVMECKRFYILEECHCKPVYQLGEGANCTLLQMACAKKVTHSINENFNWYCNCPVPCNFHEYDVQLSYSKLAGSRETKHQRKLDESYISKNIVGIGVYYEDLSFDHIQQQASIDAGSFLSDLGGQMGLFVGMSLLTMLEFIEYFMARTYMSFKGFTRGRISKSTEE
ncbi:acid-sensing ion channel 5-like isoform X2 [Lineus longissimus]